MTEFIVTPEDVGRVAVDGEGSEWVLSELLGGTFSAFWICLTQDKRMTTKMDGDFGDDGNSRGIRCWKDQSPAPDPIAALQQKVAELFGEIKSLKDKNKSLKRLKRRVKALEELTQTASNDGDNEPETASEEIGKFQLTQEKIDEGFELWEAGPKPELTASEIEEAKVICKNGETLSFKGSILNEWEHISHSSDYHIVAWKPPERLRKPKADPDGWIKCTADNMPPVGTVVDWKRIEEITYTYPIALESADFWVKEVTHFRITGETA